MDLDRAGFYAKTKQLKKDEMHSKLMDLFKLIEYAEEQGGFAGDWDWELLKGDAGLPTRGQLTE